MQGAELLVTTDRERIEEATREIVHRASSGDFDPLKRHLDEDFRGASGYFQGKAEAVRYVAATALRYGLTGADLLNLEVEEAEGGRARARVKARLRFREVREPAPLLLNLDAQWVERAKGWRILEVTRVW